jgi:hypothetical protein
MAQPSRWNASTWELSGLLPTDATVVSEESRSRRRCVPRGIVGKCLPWPLSRCFSIDGSWETERDVSFAPLLFIEICALPFPQPLNPENAGQPENGAQVVRTGMPSLPTNNTISLAARRMNTVFTAFQSRCSASRCFLVCSEQRKMVIPAAHDHAIPACHAGHHNRDEVIIL